MSPAIGGIIVGYEIGRQLDVETIFAERTNGILQLRRSFNIKEKSNVLIVEDVITTGKSALECAELVKKSKSNLLGYSCIINRTNNDNPINKNIISLLKIELQTFQENKIPDSLRKIKAIKPGSR